MDLSLSSHPSSTRRQQSCAHPAWWTSLASIPPKHSRLRDAVASGFLTDVEFRKTQIRAVVELLQANAAALFEAVRKDIGRHPAHSKLVLGGCVGSCKNALASLDEWVKPVSKGVQTAGFAAHF